MASLIVNYLHPRPKTASAILFAISLLAMAFEGWAR